MFKASIKVITGKPMTVWTAEDSKDIGTDIETKIDKRVDAGVDVNGKAFKPYSAAYAKRKGKTQVNLTDTGAMMNSLGTTADVDGATISVSPAYAKYVDAGRSFMGLSQAEVDEVMREVERLYDEHVAAANKGAKAGVIISGGK